MYYTIYETKNLITNEIYVGQHKTKNINDNYLGSGLIIQNSIKKYGKENFSKTILHIFDTFEEMDAKEAEIVTVDFIQRADVLNVIPGGVGFKTKTSVVCRKIGDKKYIRIPSEEFYSNHDLYEAVAKGTLIIIDEFGHTQRIDSSTYDKSIHKTPSSGKLSVYNKELNKTMRIDIELFDSEKHTKTFGGIVSTVDGITRYVSKEEFETLNLSGVHKNKVTAYDENGTLKHIDKLEYFTNKSKYKHISAGTIPVTHKITKETKRIPVSDIDLYREEYYISTEGQITVFDVELKKYKNIPKTDFDRTKHKRSKDKKFIMYNQNGDVLLEYWGDKKYFLEYYKLPERVWYCLLKSKPFVTKNETLQQYNNCYFKLIDWKLEYEL